MERPAGREDIGLYVHIPFCRAQCPYCDFNSYSGQESLVPRYVAALRREMELWAGLVPPVATVYLGGGTPSLLSLPQVECLLQTLQATFSMAPEVEKSMEANPGTVTLPYLRGLRSLGIDRLSLGVQSLDDGELKLLGRI